MPNFNTATLVGHLGRDADLRYTEGGTAVISFSLAVTEKWKTKAGAQQEKTDWFRVNYFGKGAEAVSAFLTKGRAVLVQGSIGSSEWTDKSGAKKFSLEIKAERVKMLDRGTSATGEGEQAAEPAKASSGDLDSDLPF